MFASVIPKASSSDLSSPSDMSGSGNWSSLPGDVWFLIGLRLDSASDRIRLRAVSKSIRSNLPYRQPPWLMLSEFHSDDEEEGEEEEDDEEEEVPPPKRRFVILGEQRYYKWDLPQAHFARCVGSTSNWVITVNLDTIIRLLNPFTKVEIDLPDGLTFGNPYYEVKPLPPEEDIIRRDTFLSKVIISPPCPSSSLSGGTDFLVIALHNHGRIAMAKPGDSSWTTFEIDITKYHPGVRDMIVYQGLLYAITFTGLLLSSDFLTTYPNPPQLYGVGQFDVFKPHYDRQPLYLVEWCGHLLLVIKSVNMFGLDDMGRYEAVPFYKTDGFQIYKFDFPTTNWVEIKSLGEYSLFLGYNTSVSVLASDYFGLVKKNCIYFTDDFVYGFGGTSTPGGYDMGVFDLEDKSITPHYKGKSTCDYSPPIWIVPDQ